MGNLIRTNTNIYKARIREYILNSIAQTPHIALGGHNTSQASISKDKLVGLLHSFDVEFNHVRTKQRTPNLQARLGDWLNGSPSAINLPMYYKDILTDTMLLHDTEILTVKEQEIICNNFHSHIALHILNYAKTLNINLTKLY